MPSIQCPAHVRMGAHEKPQICDLPHGGHGYCCTTGRNFTNHGKFICIPQFFRMEYLKNPFVFVSTIKKNKPDEKHPKTLSKGRSAASDLSNNLITLINSMITEANHHLNDLSNHEPEVAVASPHQPDFIHNLMFR